MNAQTYIKVGRTIMADTGRPRRRNLGIIEQFNDVTNEVFVFDKSNPIGYQHYVISFTDCSKWFNEGLYA